MTYSCRRPKSFVAPAVPFLGENYVGKNRFKCPILTFRKNGNKVFFNEDKLMNIALKAPTKDKALGSVGLFRSEAPYPVRWRAFVIGSDLSLF